jgi:SAM-dependent methyltransferase
MARLVDVGGWQGDIEQFVLAQLPTSPVRVLEVGCGEGYLAAAMSQAGHDVLAVDPRAPEGAIFRQLKLEDVDEEAGPFDYIVGILALHHIHDLGAAVDKIARMLKPEGALVLAEFGWDRFDEATARWCLERLPPARSEDDVGWLQRCCGEWAAAIAAGEELAIADHCRHWAGEEGLHSSAAMVTELERRFRAQLFEWVPYLYPDLDEETSADVEQAAIEAGAITATGFRYVGTRL